ncbi:MAG: carbohydrate binding family 9 domain-containing protein [Flavobacteriaceae bacterium]|nr:carbohydrate binding family 9 domain-containing protein [Flavobacteriaceae bacterium]
MSLSGWTVGCFLILASTTWAQYQPDNDEVVQRTYTASKIIDHSAPEIDGHLDDPVWELASWDGNFVEWQPAENTPPGQPTDFKMVYDDKFLYVAVRCFDSVPQKIERRLSRRDSFQGDRVTVMIDSYHDKRTAFAFTTTAAGVKGEEFMSDNGNNWDESWNPIWYTNAKIDEQGYTVEMKIPFSQLKFGKAEEQVWGLQVFRTLFRDNERSVWQRIPREVAGFTSEFGLLRGLQDIAPQKQLEIQPFAVSQYDTYPEEEGNPFRDGSDYPFNVGLDAKIGITNDLTLDLTVNPDFGQVDADPGAIALDGFQIFFQERRPFFVENKNIFDFRFAGGNDNLFYSRRIGRSPQGFASPADGEFVDAPTNTTILGAAKFSGKTKDGWSVGLLESVTANMYARVVDQDGEERKELVEPLTNYLVGRVQKDFNNRNSYIGGIFTATNRNIQDDLSFLHRNAYTGGIDFRHSWKDREYYVEGNLVLSNVQGSEEAISITQQRLTHLFQRVDAGHVEVDPNRTSLTGTGGKFEMGKAGGGNWRYEGGLLWRSPELELNDVGFLRQADEIVQYAEVYRLFLKPTDWYRQINMGIEQNTNYDFEGNYNRIQYQFNGFISWINNWWTEVGGAHKPRIFSNTVLRGGPRWRYSEENYAFLFFGSDQSKKFNFVMGYVNSQAKQDNFSLERYVLRFQYQPFSSLNISLSTEYEKNPNKTQYVTETDFNGDPRYILGGIDQQTFSTSLRFNYSINPNLSIQFYGQPFISRGVYSDFNRVMNPVAEDLNERVSLFTENQISKNESGTYLVDEDLDGQTDYSFSDPDFAFVQFRSNLVVRWEYIPGSELFFVWSQGVTGFGDPMGSLGSNLDRQILGQKPDNTFLIKATYRFIL